ncbi:tail protein X [Pseudomonas sp. 5P_3.1_Bac2]|uniref:tail protein X n=1 Tax=Pseudomonas sp. 5P_3.1_Bac2 TaxID=2971617 RepID=UPI0021CAD636|nr:tail protein X [Pseudomonas sp. 5P_3.1_Bac2]MCU1718672.1 tail protein X [Pseudomonas sp. 5P_3.1_Bac2]
MSDNYLTHITSAGERWDQLSSRYYGSAVRYAAIVKANPHVPISRALPAGLKLLIPLLEVQPISADLPPWLR